MSRSSRPHATPEDQREALLNAQRALADAQLRIEVLETFMALSEAAATTADLTRLAQHAETTLRRTIPDLLAAYYELQDGRWVAQVSTEGVPDELLALIQGGLATDHPCFARTVAAREPTFFENWNAQQQRVPFTELFHAIGLAPFFRGHQPYAMLTVGISSSAVWSAAHRQLFTAVFQALLAAQQRGVLAEQHERQLALEAFTQLTEAIGNETDRVRLAERARALLKASLPAWSVGYYELHTGLWRAQVAAVPSAELQDGLLVGLPQTTPVFLAAAESGQPVFCNEWNAQAQQFPQSEAFGATAFYPYFHAGMPVAMFAIGSEEHRRWTPADRAVFLAVGRSLGLALERTWQIDDLETAARQLRNSNQELLAANEELEAFAYSASHDLRTPVRHIKSFAELLRRELGNPDLSRATRSLEVIEGAADQMTLLIDAMLSLSRSGQQPLKREPIDLEALVTQARQDIQGEAGARQIIWRVAALPEVMGDRALLRQVMINLLSNAVKFTRAQPRAVIEVSAAETAQEWLIRVSDNGVGFDPAYQAKLFGPFQRLHPQHEFEGTGIGLSTVRRIILRHGGRVTAHSTPGQGAVFSFSLPRTWATSDP